jgi:cell division protein FtsW
MAAISPNRPRPARPDYLILLVVAALTVAGFVIVYSASFAIGLNDYNNVNYFVVKQAMGITVGTVLMVFFARLDYHHLARWSPIILLLSLMTLAAVLIPGIGHGSNGAHRWIQMGPLPPVQPAEFAKLSMVIYIAAWLAAKGEQVRQFSLGVLPFVLMVGLVGGLIMLEPDMGTFLVIVLTTSTMFFVAGAALSHVITLGAAGAAGCFLLILVEGYRADRLLAFLHAEQDPDGRGFQILQLLIALGSGGVRGLGLGESRQKFFYVPGAHTDGIFAIVGEELGFIGAMLILALFATLIVRGLRTAHACRDDFGYLLAVGVTCWIGYQAVINIGGVTRSLPLTGIPLPFLSYGNSALMAVLAAVGVLISVSRFGSGSRYLSRRAKPTIPRPATSRRAARVQGEP